MENASKALIMAGGILILILLVTLLVYAWGLFSEYQSSKDELAEIEDTAKFNEQLSQYDRDDVDGYTLLSLINRIIDYNERNTTDSKYEVESYPCIEMTIDMGEQRDREKLTYDNILRLFTRREYLESEFTAVNRNTSNSFRTAIEEKINTGLGSLEPIKAEKVARSISSIFKTQAQIEDDAIRQYGVANDTTKAYIYTVMINEYNTASGENLTIDNIDQLIIGSGSSNQYYTYACQYYEYMQFKRGIFKCVTFDYDTTTGRVNRMEFQFTGEIN